MKLKYQSIAFVCALALPLARPVQATSIRLNFDYMATNLKGAFSTASGATATTVGELYLTDHNDIGVANPFGGLGGVRASFRLLPNGLSQFGSGVGSVFISAFELNFPNTSECSAAPPNCTQTEDANGYDSDANGGLGNNWLNVAGVPLSGGIEWAENGSNNGWGAGATDPAFGQEYNWGNGGTLNQLTGLSVIDIFSATGRDDISIAHLLANPVGNTDPALPDAFAWIKVRSNASADPAARGIATDQWWGTPQTSGAGANQRWQLNVLATGSQIVDLSDVPTIPEPGTLWLTGGLLGAMLRWNRGRTSK